ncbi:hypothetical protein HBN50_07945 [Halobacteriovorax sp. GB3]|uniref:hypothetical protein n=1 Tax=Halobacteriovorax sp. GB3 TaxID=2719615 RepID=UPI002362A3B0|nr:hypothetical protein [Halobacteriovorax sp. GB3]MDD0853024.1 hypothetical protein [Halobacteriovorax sp. GB3]
MNTEQTNKERIKGGLSVSVPNGKEVEFHLDGKLIRVRRDRAKLQILAPEEVTIIGPRSRNYINNLRKRLTENGIDYSDIDRGKCA